MAPVIWGLDLKEMQWGKFKSSYMWNTEFHLRRTKFIVYQGALIFLVVSESLGTATLSDYIDAQRFIAKRDPRAYLFNNDYVGVASYNIWAGVYTAFIFGAAFFFDLFWPERREWRSVRLAWKICGVLSVVFVCASAFALTVITAKNCAYVTGVPEGLGKALLRQFPKDGGVPLCYRHDGRAVAAVVFVWPGFLCTIASCILLFLSIDHTENGPGPKTAHARRDDAAAAEAQMSNGTEQETEKTTSPEDASPTHPPAHPDGADEAVTDAPPMAETR